MKKIKNYPGYFIDKSGCVYSDRFCKNRIKLKPRISNGYWSLFIRKNNRYHKVYIHRLLLEAFVGECPLKNECRHLNGNRLDNNLDNLKWGTRSENQLDRNFTGTGHRGELSPMNKLTMKQVLKIRRLAKQGKIRKTENGCNYKNIGKIFNTAPSNIGSIVTRRSWSWLAE